MASGGNQWGGKGACRGGESWKSGKSVESVWGPGSFGVKDAGSNNSNAGQGGYSSSNTGSTNTGRGVYIIGCPILLKILQTFLSKKYVVPIYEMFGFLSFQSFPASSRVSPVIAKNTKDFQNL